MDKDYKTAALKLADEVGNLMRRKFALGMAKEWKQDDTPLTETDTGINRMVIETVKREFPGHSVVGEEESYGTGSEWVWVCDPVDGTIPFSHGYPMSVFSLALVHEGEPVLGVVMEPFMKRLVVGEKGAGVYLNGDPIKVNKVKLGKKAIIALEADYKLGYLRNGLIEKHDCFVPSVYSAVYTGMLVACGEFAGLVYEYNKPWDAAALKVIIEEAGGKVSDLEGKPQRYDKVPIKGFIASNGVVHGGLVELVKGVQMKGEGVD